MTAASKAAAVFRANGNTWQERPVKPPPYAPTAKQIEAVFAELLAKVADSKPNALTNLVYDHAVTRDLRVVLLTKRTEPQQRFSLQVQVNPTGQPPAYEELEVVDSAGTPATWEPLAPVPAESKAELRAKVADLETRLAIVEGKQ